MTDQHAATGVQARGRRGLMKKIFGRREDALAKMLRREIADQLEVQRQAHAADLQRVVDTLREIEAGHYRNLRYAGQHKAVQASADFVDQHLATAVAFGHPHATLEHALTLAPSGGMALEFGVFAGTTLRIIADKRRTRQVYGFDSFQGLPEIWRSDFPAGAFAVDKLPEVQGAELVVGWFDATLPRFLEHHAGPVDFLHVDCDLYSSTKIVLDLVGPRLRVGSIVMFDEFFNYPGWQQHEAKAWNEFLQRTGMQVSYEAYTFNNEQVVARVTAV